MYLFLCSQVYDTPPMAVKGPNGRDPLLDVYDVPPSVEKGLQPSSHHAVGCWQVPGLQVAVGQSGGNQSCVALPVLWPGTNLEVRLSYKPVLGLLERIAAASVIQAVQLPWVVVGAVNDDVGTVSPSPRVVNVRVIPTALGGACCIAEQTARDRRVPVPVRL